MVTITKDFEYYVNLPLRTMRGSNMITAMDLDDDMKLGLYYLMTIYHLGFHHCVRGDWEWVSLSHSEDSGYLSGDQIRELDLDIEVYNRLKNDFDRGIFPDGYKGKRNNVEEVEEPTFAYTGEFGWLSPLGKFIPSPWGEHEGSAYDIIKESGWRKDYNKWYEEEHNGLPLARDYLSEVRGFVLVHSPGMSGYDVTHIKPLTKRQKEFLYDYFMALGNVMRASHYIEED